MKLLASSKNLEKEFIRLLTYYNDYYWCTAWASSSHPLFSNILANAHKINCVSVGLRFYQTHPDFFGAIRENEGVRLIKQSDGTSHSEIYLFQSSKYDWELIISSVNFTQQAFTVNTEAGMQLTSKNDPHEHIYLKAIKQIWRIWQLQQQKLKN